MRKFNDMVISSHQKTNDHPVFGPIECKKERRTRAVRLSI